MYISFVIVAPMQRSSTLARHLHPPPQTSVLLTPTMLTPGERHGALLLAIRLLVVHHSVPLGSACHHCAFEVFTELHLLPSISILASLAFDLVTNLHGVLWLGAGIGWRTPAAILAWPHGQESVDTASFWCLVARFG